MQNTIPFRSQQSAQLKADEARFEAGTLDVETFVERNFDALFERHVSHMPYGTAKARDGDPMEWLIDHYSGVVNDVQSLADALHDRQKESGL